MKHTFPILALALLAACSSSTEPATTYSPGRYQFDSVVVTLDPVKNRGLANPGPWDADGSFPDPVVTVSRNNTAIRYTAVQANTIHTTFPLGGPNGLTLSMTTADWINVQVDDVDGSDKEFVGIMTLSGADIFGKPVGQPIAMKPYLSNQTDPVISSAFLYLTQLP